jgi:hypothetical protein
MNLFYIVFLRRYFVHLTGVLLLWQSLLSGASAQAPYSDKKTAEGWAWSQIKQGLTADFNQHCGSYPKPDPTIEDDPRWMDACRNITPAFLQDLLTKTPWRDSIPISGVQIKGARIASALADRKGLDLKNAKLISSLEISNSRIEEVVNLTHVITDNFISFNSSYMGAAFKAAGLHSSSDLSLADGALVKGPVDIRGATIKGNVSFKGSHFENELLADATRIGGYLELSSMDSHKTSFKNIILSSAKVGGDIKMQNSDINGSLNAYNVQVGGYLTLMDTHFSAKSNIAQAQILGVANFDKARFDEGLEAYGLQVGGYLSTRNAIFGSTLNMAFSKLGNNLDVRNATIANLDLSGASVAAELQLGSHDHRPNWKTKDGKNGSLNLRNARVGTLMDTEQAWPSKGHLLLSGATFGHFGGSEGQTERDMLRRGAEWWDEHWAELDPNYSPSPYEQLAIAFTAIGDRDNANAIRYREREHERHVAMADGKWATVALLSVLSYVAGYGIGLHTFRVLYWVVGLSLLFGMLLWWLSPEARKAPRGRVWCFGACLSRLLPVIEINKEFTDFFNDPERKNLSFWASILFSTLGVIGWILGGVLVIAVSGLTQSH